MKKIILSIATISLGISMLNFTLATKKDNKVLNKVEAQQIIKEEEKKEEKFIGVNKEGMKYADDAKKVAEKLNNYDYTNDGKKVVYLTFDDGPSTTNTPDILDILKQEDVKATFFVNGKNAEAGKERSKELIKRAFDEGNAIANHSWSHDYKILYPNRTLNIDNFKEDFNKTDEMLKEILGENFSTNVLRCPGGYMSWKEMEPLDNYLKENNKASIDWNALNKDAEGPKKNAEQLVQEAINTSNGKEMVVLLMHDTYGKEETVKALPDIIKYFKDSGYEFRTLI